MTIDRQSYGVVEVVTPRGPLVRDELEEFVHAAETVARERAGRLVIDMQDVPYMDSKGIEVLQALGAEGDTFVRPRIAQLNETCREALALTRVLPRLEVFDSVESAIRSMRD